MFKRAPRVSLKAHEFVTVVEHKERVCDVESNRFDLVSFPDTKQELKKIEDFIKDKYKLVDETIWDCIYINDGYYIGSEYIFDDAGFIYKDDSTYMGMIAGKVSIILKTGIIDEKKSLHGPTKGCYYVFRTWIASPPNSSYEDYNKFCKKIIQIGIDLGLKMVRSVIPIPLVIKYGGGGYPIDPYLEPVFIEEKQKFDIKSFQNFMKKIEAIAEKYPLKSRDFRLDLYL